MQHRSLSWHLERMVKWAEDVVARGGHAKGDPSMGTPRMEMKKFGKSYSSLLQLLLEHAQMEETVLFQILESADRGTYLHLILFQLDWIEFPFFDQI